MNEVKVFNGVHGDMPLRDQLSVYGSFACTLAFAKMYQDEGNYKEASRLMGIASEYVMYFKEDIFSSLYGGIWDSIMVTKYLGRHTEFYYHNLFDRHISTIIPSANVVRIKNDGRNIPDSWVSIDGDIIPVEIKSGKFNTKALAQLRRYMNAYEAKVGIAVGDGAAVAIPDDVIFIETSELDRLEELYSSAKMFGGDK